MAFSDSHTFPKSPVLPNTPWYSLYYIGWLDAEKALVHFPHFVSNVPATIVSKTHINDLSMPNMKNKHTTLPCDVHCQTTNPTAFSLS